MIWCVTVQSTLHDFSIRRQFTAHNSPRTIHRAQFTVHSSPCKINRSQFTVAQFTAVTNHRRHHSPRHNSPRKNQNSAWWVLDSTRLLLDDCWVSDIWVLHSARWRLNCSRWLLNSAKSLFNYAKWLDLNSG
jgi:hypothetical protein